MPESQMPITEVLTREERDAMTPDDVLKRLMNGNERFQSGSLTSRDHSKQVQEAAEGQSPMAVILSCIDSRVPVEDVFDQGIGDVFVARVAGNFENPDILGSMEFSCLSEADNGMGGGGAKLIFILGHESCGAIRHAINGTDLGNISAMLQNIKPAIDSTTYEGAREFGNTEFVNLVGENNVRLTMNRILERSELLRNKVKNGKIKIVGGVYRMGKGKIELLTD